MNKETVKTLAIIVLLIAVIIFAGFKATDKIEQKGYEQGMNDGITQIALTQTQTGDVYFISNNTLDSRNINEICGVEP